MDYQKESTTPTHRHLAKETVMRIEVSLSSRRSSVVVFNTTARVVTLGKGEWTSVAYGAPCIILLRETIAPDSPFQVRFAIAELESGISIWEQELTSSVDYVELQPGFHSFKVNGQTLAVQFADPAEAFSFYNSLKQYLEQKEKVDQILEESKIRKATERKSSKKDKKKPQSSTGRRFSKLDISQPCEFRHLSGITSGHTDICQRELQGTMDRQRSASLGAISTKQVKQRGRLPSDMTDGYLYSPKKQEPGEAVPTATVNKQANNKSKKEVQRGKFKFSSFRMTKRKPLIQQLEDEYKNKDDMDLGAVHSTDDILGAQREPMQDEKRKMSLPSLSAVSSTSFVNDKESNSGSVVAGTNISPSHVAQGWREDTVKPSEVQISPPLPSPSRAPLQPIIHQQPNNYKFKHVKPSFNTYDLLEPIDSKPKAALSAPGKQHGAPNLIAMMNPLKSSNSENKRNPSPVHRQFESTTQSNDSTSSRSTTQSPVSGTVRTGSSEGTSTPSDLGGLTEELSRVLREFDELISPQSPLVSTLATFQQPHSTGKETMV